MAAEMAEKGLSSGRITKVERGVRGKREFGTGWFLREGRWTQKSGGASGEEERVR